MTSATTGQPFRPSPTAPICHTVTFRLCHDPGSVQETEFLADAETILTAIPGVEQFTQLRQISPKSDLQWAFSMLFADEDAYRAYNSHPDHLRFVGERWDSEVTTFQELDFVALERPATS